MSPADPDDENPTEPPAVNPGVREALDRHEDELEAPEAEDAGDRDEEPDEQTEGEAPTG